ncbi:MAG: hypothetical protein WAW75_03515, partial [Gallionella sp.]
DLKASYVSAVYDSQEDADAAKNPVLINADNAIQAANHGCYYAEDGTLMNADGTRSVFDDVDQ